MLSLGFALRHEFQDMTLIYHIRNTRLETSDIFIAFRMTGSIKNSKAPAGSKAFVFFFTFIWGKCLKPGHFWRKIKRLHLQLRSSLIFDGQTVSLKEKAYKNVSLAFSNTHKGAATLFTVASYLQWDALKILKENAEKKEM